MSLLRNLSPLVFLITCFTTSYAQRSNYTKALWVGMNGGAHLSRYQFTPSVTQNQHLGLHFGALARIDLEKGASAQIALNYVETGWQERYDDDSSLSFRREIKYIEMPILTHLYLENSVARIFVNIGPFVGYYTGDKSVVSGETFNETQRFRQTEPIKSRIAWGLTGGPGLSIKLGKRHRIEAEGHILYNFQDIWSTRREDPYGGSSELRFGISLNYLYKI